MAPPAATKDRPAEDLRPAALLTCLELVHTVLIPTSIEALPVHIPSRAYFTLETTLVNSSQ